MPAAQIDQHAAKIDAVWGTVEAGTWKSAHPGMLVSQYFIMGLDQYSVTHHGLSWWQQNHPGWILYACTSGGTPTHDVAYMSGVDVPDVPIDIHNPAAVAYQAEAMAQAARSGGYNALAVDAPVGRPCAGVTANGSVYSRRFSGGFSIVNASASTQSFRLPSGSYRDIEGRAVSSTLTLGPNGAYVLVGGSGC